MHLSAVTAILNSIIIYTPTSMFQSHRKLRNLPNLLKCVNPFVTGGTYMSHLKESFQDHWDKSIPLFLHAAIYLEVSLFRWTSQNAFSSETAVCKSFAMQNCTRYHLYTAVSRENAFWLVQWNREILQGRWQHGEKVEYCYTSGLEKAVCEIYTGCFRRNVPDFGRIFFTLKYTDITQNTYIQSWTVTEIMAREKCGLLAVPLTVPVKLTLCPYTAHVRPWEWNAVNVATAM